MICPACRAVVSWVQFCPQCGVAVPAIESVYEPTVVLGHGTTSNVYDARERATDRRVALRLVHWWHASHRSVRERFRETGERLSGFAHDHAIRLVLLGEEKGPRLYVVTERVQATRLDAEVARGAMPWSRAAEILAQLCAVLGAIHARGVVHAKLTSAKIYLTQRQGSGGDPYREARLDDIVRLDVGCCPAGALGADASMRLDRSPDLRFQSPEQLGGRTLDARSDVFSLGVLAYEMVTGRPPFPDRPRYAQLVTRLEPPSRHVPLSPRAEAVIVRCLEVDRERRFASTGELRAALLDGAGRETIDP